VPEWNNQELTVAQEEDVVVDAKGLVSWVMNRQTDYHLIE
jgi:hypothetical protein